MKLSSQDKRDLDKYTKFLALKSTQIIVQSRLGERISTSCKAKTKGTDWFNLHINDLPDVLAETRKALNGEIISTCVPLCVEISLRTVDGDQMVLESWCLSLLPDQCDPTVRIIHTIYNQMGILLKSLVSVTRVTPAYKLSRRQGPDTYVICYRIYMDQPQLHNLGEGYEQRRIGQICTPIGTVQLSVAYRVKMTISPTQTGRDNSIMLKSDHFNTNLSPRNNMRKQCDKKIDMSKPLRPGAFVDPKDVEKNTFVAQPQLPIVTRLLAMGQKKKSESDQDDDNLSIKSTTSFEMEKREETKDDENGNTSSPSPNNSSSPSPVSKTSIISTTSKLASSRKSFLFPLNAPFSEGGKFSDLAGFFRFIYQPIPTLDMESSVASDDVEKQIEIFESKMGEYDELVQSLYQSPDN